jgi:hypothetical protein
MTFDPAAVGPVGLEHPTALPQVAPQVKHADSAPDQQRLEPLLGEYHGMVQPMNSR